MVRRKGEELVLLRLTGLGTGRGELWTRWLWLETSVVGEGGWVIYGDFEFRFGREKELLLLGDEEMWLCFDVLLCLLLSIEQETCLSRCLVWNMLVTGSFSCFLDKNWLLVWLDGKLGMSTQ